MELFWSVFLIIFAFVKPYGFSVFTLFFVLVIAPVTSFITSKIVNDYECLWKSRSEFRDETYSFAKHQLEKEDLSFWEREQYELKVELYKDYSPYYSDEFVKVDTLKNIEMTVMILVPLCIFIDLIIEFKGLGVIGNRLIGYLLKVDWSLVAVIAAPVIVLAICIYFIYTFGIKSILKWLVSLAGRLVIGASFIFSAICPPLLVLYAAILLVVGIAFHIVGSKKESMIQGTNYYNVFSGFSFGMVLLMAPWYIGTVSAFVGIISDYSLVNNVNYLTSVSEVVTNGFQLLGREGISEAAKYMGGTIWFFNFFNLV